MSQVKGSSETRKFVSWVLCETLTFHDELVQGGVYESPVPVVCKKGFGSDKKMES